MLKFSSLAAICNGTVESMVSDCEVVSLELDSRKAIASEGAVFLCMAGERHDAHRFLPDLYASGFRQFIIEKPVELSAYPKGNFLKVPSSLFALQVLAEFHRGQFSCPVIGITGSNGKTIIKEWLYQLLSPDFKTVKNPGSYNSQIGVPLSVWQFHKHHELGIFEAGISRPGEMERLQRIIQPTIGIFTNLGTAHNEGFDGSRQKILEKLKLFSDADVIVYCKDQTEVAVEIESSGAPRQILLSWGISPQATISRTRQANSSYCFFWKDKEFIIRFPFSDVASIENASHCVAMLIYFGYSPEQIQERVSHLKTVPMRLELKPGINHCQLVDDTYNNDLGGLQISLDFLVGLQKKKRTLILSDILQSGMNDHELCNGIATLVSRTGINSFIGIGPMLKSRRELFDKVPYASFCESTEEFLEKVNWSIFQDEAILIKGARIFQFEKIVSRLQSKIHSTIMEIDLGAMVHNLNYFRARLKPGTKLMVMVKAFAYGSGSEEVGNLLQYHNVDYLGVAFPDEGVALRKNQVRLPIMVMNPTEESFSTLMTHSLEPEVYSLPLLKSLTEFLNGAACKIHLKIDSGMHRLGFEQAALKETIAILQANKNIEISSVFSHLAGADESIHDNFTREQVRCFLSMADALKEELKINPLLHILNSSGILRFPDLQFDMVRLGIGLYGVNPTESGDQLKVVATLKTIISQIKIIKEGESIGYARKGHAEREMKLATLAIGYADGFSRSFSSGKGAVWINGKRAPVIGNVCMDMTMVDVTGINAKEGDEVIIFGKEMPIDQLAKSIQTIPYELLTGTSERVKRVFHAESI